MLVRHSLTYRLRHTDTLTYREEGAYTFCKVGVGVEEGEGGEQGVQGVPPQAVPRQQQALFVRSRE
jgi:hypothetical protein